MAQDPARELADLTLVHGLNIQVAQGVLGHPVPVPAGLSGGVSSPDRLAVQLNILRRWLNLLDLAITPAILRQSLPIYSNTKSCEATLRYLVGKPQRTDSDRDKCDLVATFLFRSYTGNAGHSLGDIEGVPPFALELFRILELAQDTTLSSTHLQLTREFPFLRDEIQDFRDFNELIDSGLIDRVRDLKHSFGDGFFHPLVLAVIAEYNDMLGERFSELFHDAARQIKEFAGRVQNEGGSIMAPLGDGITVKHLVDMEVGNLLQQDYTHARERFRKVTKYKKAVASRSGAAKPVAAAKAASAMPPLPLGIQMPARPQPSAAPAATGAVPSAIIQNTVEDSKLKNMEESIRNFVRAGGDKPPSMMPLKNASVAVSPAEADAFRADFGNEQSFRADYAATIRRMVAIQGRIALELADFKSKESSVYLWKPHADSLAFLVRTAQQALDNAGRVVTAAEQRGLSEKVTVLNLTVQRLRWDVTRTLKLLEAIQIAPPRQ